nr:uncharacterized protein [Tanacetum cinerariifolium]
MFAFTSMGGKVDNSVNRRGRGPYVFCLHGQTYHSMGSLLPQEESVFYNNIHVLFSSNSSGSSGRSNSKNPIDRDIMNEVKDVLDTSSDLVKTFSRARDQYNEDSEQNIRIKLVAKRGRDGQTYNLPTSNEVASLIVGDFDTCIEQRDIVIEKHREGLNRINIFHPLCLPLQYPLLMLCGQDGYHLEISHRKKYGEPAIDKKYKTVSMREWFSYQIQDHTNQENLFTRTRRLFQQFLLDGYTIVERERLYFHRAKQSKLRCDTYSNICSSIAAGNTDPIVLGKPVVLSSLFTGGQMYMRQNYMDAMALCRCKDDPSQACMVDKKCSKHFPKKFMQHSSVDLKGYPVYRRRDDSKYVEKSGHHLHNTFVIPYNATLLKRYQCHINVEWCNQTRSIKYLFKYINEGPNRVSAELYEPDTTAACRLFGFEVQYRTPSVERLSFHLLGEQQVLYVENPDLETVLHKPSIGHSIFEGWMKINELYSAARELTYVEFPTKYVWNAPKRIWTLRKQGKSIGRIHNVSISTGDAFYCRMLLNSAKGCRTHDEIKKVNGVVYPTYKEACYATSLSEDDKEYIACIKDATHWETAEHLRELFVTLLSQKELTMPLSVWLQTWHLLAKDVQFKRRQILKRPGTGKTFLWKTLAAGIRRKGDIVLNVASSDIASLLMSGGRTANSRFHIPINIDETSTCSICSQSDLGALLKKCKLIIWDEAPMTNKLCFEALDRTLDVRCRTRYDTCEMPFGNMTMVFGGDFRQVLSVIPKGSRHDISNVDAASLKLKLFKDVAAVAHAKLQKLDSQLEIHGVSLSQEDVNLKFLRSLPSE